MAYLLPLIFIAEEPAETPQREHVSVWVGNVDRPYPEQSNEHIAQHLCPWAGLKKK